MSSFSTSWRNPCSQAFYPSFGQSDSEEGQYDLDSDNDPEDRISVPNKDLVVLDKFLEEAIMVPDAHPTLSQMKSAAEKTAKRKTDQGAAKKDTPVKAA
jgi:hypothetical protein